MIKGEWSIGRTSAAGFISIRSEDQRTICEVLPQLPSETQANAQAIAALPELVRALEMALDMLKTIATQEILFNAPLTIQICKEALAKAGGGK